MESMDDKGKVDVFEALLDSARERAKEKHGVLCQCGLCADARRSKLDHPTSCACDWCWGYSSSGARIELELNKRETHPALASGAVDTWTGQIGGRILQAPAIHPAPDKPEHGSRFHGAIPWILRGAKCRCRKCNPAPVRRAVIAALWRVARYACEAVENLERVLGIDD